MVLVSGCCDENKNGMAIFVSRKLNLANLMFDMFVKERALLTGG